MYRRILEDLKYWKNKKNRKPLLLSGARQTGKTYIIKEFSNDNFDDYLEVNFEKDVDARDLFNESLDPKEIIIKLENYYNKRILPNKTLIFFDEVQACPPAITSLKYFYEDANEYYIIAAGSLLGVAINRKFKNKEFSFPVGKVDQLKLYPMNFEEFLMALDENILIDTIRNSYKENKALDEVIHKKALKLYRQYLSIGGMPEAVGEYINSRSFVSAASVVANIYSNYVNDTSKYANTNEAIKNKALYESVVSQLLKPNKNFKYSEVTKGKNSQYFNSSIDWLINAGVILKSHLLKSVGIPLNSHYNDFLFRIYLSDVGLFRYKTNVSINDIQDIDYKDDLTGVLGENYVAQELSSYNIPLCYWKGKLDAEIEFMIQKSKNVIPIEVKAGRNVSSASLNIYKNTHSVDYVYRVSMKNFGLENNIKSVPLYAVFCMCEEIIKS